MWSNFFTSGWAMAVTMFIFAYNLNALYKSLMVKYRTYRVTKGREQMNEWLALVGRNLDGSYKDGTPYSKDAVKKFLADCSVEYFKRVIEDNKKEE